MKKIYPENKKILQKPSSNNDNEEEKKQENDNEVKLFEREIEPNERKQSSTAPAPSNNNQNNNDDDYSDEESDLSFSISPPIPITHQTGLTSTTLFEYEIPKPPQQENDLENNDDDNISDESSLDSQRNKEIQDRRKLARDAKSSKKFSFKNTPTMSHIQQQKQEMKEKIVNEILEKILPDVNEYLIDGTNQQKQIKKQSKIWLNLINWLKFFGCLSLDIHDAILTGSLAQTRKTIIKLTRGKDANPELINEYDQLGCTAISYAVKIKKFELVQLLLDFNALPDFVDLKTGRTPLFYSVNNGTIDISRLLLQSGANANAVDNQCVAPLMLAATRNDVKHCQLLCNALADVDIQDDNGWTALHYAAYGNASETIIYLLQEGANRHLKDRNKRKPMHVAKFKKHGNCIAALSSKSKIGF